MLTCFPFRQEVFLLSDTARRFHSSSLPRAASASALTSAAEPNHRDDRSLPLPLVLHYWRTAGDRELANINPQMTFWEQQQQLKYELISNYN